MSFNSNAFSAFINIDYNNDYQLFGDSSFRSSASKPMEGIQEGEGIKEIWEKGKKILGKVRNIAKSETGTFVKNLLPSSDDMATKQYAGEEHVLLKLPNGKMGFANYMGPGTNLLTRLRSREAGNIHGRTEADLTAKAHDIRYRLARTNQDSKIREGLVRTADGKMINALDKIKRLGLDNDFNVNLGKRTMQAKILAEDTGLLEKGSFGGNYEPLSLEDRKLLEHELSKLEQKGYGKKSKLMKIAMKELKELKGLGKKKKGKGVGLAGRGARQAGRGARQAGLGLKRSGEGIESYIYPANRPPRKLQPIIPRKGNRNPTIFDPAESTYGKGVGRAGDTRVSGGAIDFKGIVKTSLPIIFKEISKKLPPNVLPVSKMTELMKRAKDAVKSGSGNPFKKISDMMIPLIHSELKKKGSGLKNKKDIRDELVNLFKDMSVKNGSGNKPLVGKDYKKIIRGSGFWSKLWKGIKDFGKGFAYGFNKAKDVVGKVAGYIPGIGPTIKEVADKIPSIPGAAKTIEELKQQTKGSGYKKLHNMALKSIK